MSDIFKMDNGMKNYLGIDWGESKIGLAVADGELKIATALKMIKNNNNSTQEIKKVIDENNISEIVIGVPFDAKNQDAVYGGEKFGKMIGEEISIPIHYHNEMFTTKMAQNNLIRKGEKNVGKKDDAESARIILQGWLDEYGVL